MKKIVLAAAVLFVTAGCQDHRFTPIDKAKDIKLPVQEEAKSPQRTFEKTDETAQKEVMSEAYRGDKTPGQELPPDHPETALKDDGKGPGRLLVEGTLKLDESIKDRDFGAFTIYVIAWLIEKVEEGVKPFPTAVVRYEAGDFPARFSIYEENLMGNGYPAPEAKMLLEGRLDRDGDPITKEKGDVYGFTIDPFNASAKDVTLTLNRVRE